MFRPAHLYPADAQPDLFDGNFVRYAEVYRERAPGGFYPQTAMVDLFAEHHLEKRVKILLFAVLTCIVWVSTCLAGERSYSPANGL